jgi:predicted  nucleic acid-binding Zn-ribbon protein
MATKPLSETHPALAAEWHPTLNGDKTPDMFTAGSKFKAWWLGVCGHTWEAHVGSRAKLGRGCGYCSGNNFLEGFNDLENKYPEIAKEWHPTLNGDKTPSAVFGGGHIKYWWLGKCGHEWESSVSNRLKHNCPYCGGNLVQRGFNDLESKFPELCREWHPNKNLPLEPSQINYGTNKPFWWLGKCGHEWEASVGNRVRGAGCSICAGKEVLAGFNDLASKYPELLEEWDYAKNTHLDPTKLISGSREPVWWVGKCGHKWNSQIQNRSLSGAGCPKCSAGGFSSSHPGFVYFIHNPKLMAFKVGISNPTAINNRLTMFSRQEWSVIKTWESESGLTILKVETKFFKWLRKDKQIPRFLSKSDLGAVQGASETFSDSILTQAEVIAKIEELLKQEI